MHLTEYLFRRLHQIHIRSVFGVPGDFNLTALDYIEQCGLKWIGNVNELNAGYAADGYARIKGIAAIITTFGVGELSALNALAGASAELVPVIHIVGFPSTTAQKRKLPLHHTLADGDYDVFIKMSARISSAVAMLDDPGKAPEMIDETILQCFQSSKPVYIGLPMDLVHSEVNASGLQSPLTLQEHGSLSSTAIEDAAVNVILDRILTAQNPIILVDSLAGRYHSLQPSRRFVEESNMPCYAFPMAKGVVNEGLPNFRGLFSGTASDPGVREQVLLSDLIILVGSHPTDLNTGGFKSDISQAQTITLQRDTVQLPNATFSAVCMNAVLKKLSDAVCKSRTKSLSSSPSEALSRQSMDTTDTLPDVDLGEPAQKLQSNEVDLNTPVTQQWMWERISSWLDEDDILAMDIGTSAFGALWTRHPRGATSLFQLLWCSIGFAVGGTVGAALAALEQEQETQPQRKRRTICFTGDGSLQMVAQEVSTLVRQRLGPIVFVICNEGYTVERMVHGWDKSYNDIQPWDYQLLPRVFKPAPDTVRTYSVRTKGELETLLSDEQFGPASNFDDQHRAPLRLVEIHMAMDDAPQSMHEMIASIHGK